MSSATLPSGPVPARNAASDAELVLFDLRCLVREGMMTFIRDQYPEAFPTLRIKDLAAGEKDADDAGGMTTTAQSGQRAALRDKVPLCGEPGVDRMGKLLLKGRSCPTSLPG